MLWEVKPDKEHTDYDMFDGAIVKADTKEDAEKIANEELKGNHYAWEDDKPQQWTAIPFENKGKGIVFSSFRAG